MKTISLYFQEGPADKEWSATIPEPAGSGWFVQTQWGRRGGTMQTKTYGPYSQAQAETVYQARVAEKTSKGYHPGPDAAPIVDPAFVQGAQSVASAMDAANADYRPMLLNEVSDAELLAIVYDPRYVVEIKHDGVRCILHFDGSVVRGFSRTKKDFGITKPIVDAAKAFNGTFILDGEKVGDTFWAFDILNLNGRDLRHEPLARRKVILLASFAPYRPSYGRDHRTDPGGIAIVETINDAEKKFAMIGAAKASGAEGIVLKDLDSIYTADRPNSGGPWLKYKFWASASVIVAARPANSKKAGKSSVDVMLFDGTPLGSVTVSGKLVPPVSSVVEVKYLYAMRGGSLVQPEFLSIRTDIPPEECTADQLQYKGEGNA